MTIKFFFSFLNYDDKGKATTLREKFNQLTNAARVPKETEPKKPEILPGTKINIFS